MKKLLIILLFCAAIVSAQDKVTALPFAELLKVIPSDINGFSLTGKPDGMNMTMGEMSYSSATKEFVKGEQVLKITVNDFIGYVSMYQASFGMAEGFSFEDADTKTYLETVDGVKSLISIDKKDKNTNIISGYKDRYLVIIEMSGTTNEDEVKAIFKKINLNSLP